MLNMPDPQGHRFPTIGDMRPLGFTNHKLDYLEASIQMERSGYQRYPVASGLPSSMDLSPYSRGSLGDCHVGFK